MKNIEYTLEEIANIYKTEHTSIRKLARDYDINVNRVQWAVKKYGIHKVQNHSDFPEYRKHQLDLHYFDTIDTEDKAYYLGYIYADGYVNEHYMRLCLHNQDIHILKSFCKYLGSDETIIKPYRDKYSALVVNSKEFAESLHKQGAVQAKTKILKAPNVPDNLIPHFIRGYFDGDGSIWFDKSTNSYRVQFVGTKDVLEYIEKFFGVETKFRVATKDGLIYRYGFAGNKKVSEALDKIYEGATVYLFRKHDKYLHCKELHAYKEEHKNEIWTNNLGSYARKGVK